MFDRAIELLRSRFSKQNLDLVLRGSVSLILRGAGLILKFILSWVVVRRFGTIDMGIYGLMVAGVGLASNAVSFEIGYFTTRELLTRTPWPVDVLRRQAAFHAGLYAIVLPVSMFLFVFGFLPWSMAIWFVFILITEQVSMEVYRLQVILGMQVAANFAFFLKSGGWILVLLPLFWFFPGLGMAWLWGGWIGGNLAAIALGLLFCRRAQWSREHTGEHAIAWLRRGLSVSMPYWSASIVARVGMSMDRFFLQKWAGASQVGIYTFFLNNNTAIVSFVDAAVVAYFLPRIVVVGNSMDPVRIRNEERRLLVALGSVFLGLALVSGLAIRPLLGILHRPEYLQHLRIHWILLMSIGLVVMGFYPQLRLYRQKRDSGNLWSNLIGLAAGAGLNLILVPRLHITGAALASLGTSATWLLAKLFFSRDKPCPATPSSL